MFRALIVASVISFAFYLYKNGLLYVPSFRRYDLLAASFVILVCGQILGSLSWWSVLKLDFENVSFAAAMSSIALSTFGKYLPGKMWTTAGRAAYVADVTGESLVRLTIASTRAQLITVWVGVTLGLIGALIVGSDSGTLAIIAGLSAVMLLFIVSGVLEGFSSKVHGYFKPSALPMRRMSVRHLLRVLPAFMPGPTLRMIGFYLMAGSIIDGLPWQTMFAFPLATALGMAAVFAPGGIGVREAVIVAALLNSNVSLQDATTVAVTARLWAVAGDAGLFIAGVFVNRRIKMKARSDRC